MRILDYGSAINEALILKMEADKSIYILGQGADDPTSAAGPLQNLKDKFPGRIQDVPMAEEAIAGVCVGMAMNGMRPINWHIRMDFLIIAMNQIVNMAAKVRYMYGGKAKCPVVFRSMIGKSWGQGPQHSQSFYPMFCNIPGLTVVAPVLPIDAKGVFINALTRDDPTMIIEHRLLYYQKGDVPVGLYNDEIGNRVIDKGEDITIVGVSQMAIECHRAAQILKRIGIRAEVITPVKLKPLSLEYIKESVVKTGNLLVVDSSWTQCSIGSEIVARLNDSGFTFASKRMGFAETTCPTSPTIENEFYPNPMTISAEVCKLLEIKNLIKKLENIYDKEEVYFKGPF